MLEESMAPKEAEALQAEMATIQTLPPSRKLRELRRSDPEADASDLISERFLYRGGVCLLVGPTGAGKSSLLMQLAIHLAVGKTLFGLQPGAVYRKKGMRILLVQAENDEAELAKMRDEGLVTFRRESQTIWYRIADPRVEELFSTLHRLFCGRRGR